jgi:hypothetical protein
MEKQTTLLLGFICLMDDFKITPYEKHIDIYLKDEKDKDKLRVHFIKFCFYHWDKRREKDFIEKLFKYEII